MKIRLTVIKTRRVPTLAGWLCIAAILSVALCGMARAMYPFLSVHEPVDAQVLVVEGWLPDYALAEVSREFMRRHYSLIITTGGPFEQGFYVTEYKTFAHLSAATLGKLGIDSAAIVVLPSPEIKVDRTFASAYEVKKWLDGGGRRIDAINLVSMGPHARRSRMLFQKALGPAVRVGVIPYTDRTYALPAWWTSSNGFRKVTDEAVAYCYARFIFTFKERL
jgi:uncharacterized SAM-binding protein YcdF (DUF218 family)